MDLLLLSFFNSLVQKAGEAGLTLLDNTTCEEAKSGEEQTATICWKSPIDDKSHSIVLCREADYVVLQASKEERGFSEVAQLDNPKVQQWLSELFSA